MHYFSGKVILLPDDLQVVRIYHIPYENQQNNVRLKLQNTCYMIYKRCRRKQHEKMLIKFIFNFPHVQQNAVSDNVYPTDKIFLMPSFH